MSRFFVLEVLDPPHAREQLIAHAVEVPEEKGRELTALEDVGAWSIGSARSVPLAGASALEELLR